MRKYLAAAAVLMAALAPQAAGAQTLAGTWSGLVTQTFTDGREAVFTAMVQFRPDGTAFVAYPTDACGGTLFPMSTKGTPTFREEISYGLEVCSTGGIVTLTLVDGTLDYHWTSEADGVAVGTLRPTDKAIPDAPLP